MIVERKPWRTLRRLVGAAVATLARALWPSKHANTCTRHAWNTVHSGNVWNMVREGDGQLDVVRHRAFRRFHEEHVWMFVSLFPIYLSIRHELLP